MSRCREHRLSRFIRWLRLPRVRKTIKTTVTYPQDRPFAYFISPTHHHESVLRNSPVESHSFIHSFIRRACHVHMYTLTLRDSTYTRIQRAHDGTGMQLRRWFGAETRKNENPLSRNSSTLRSVIPFCTMNRYCTLSHSCVHLTCLRFTWLRLPASPSRVVAWCPRDRVPGATSCGYLPLQMGAAAAFGKRVFVGILRGRQKQSGLVLLSLSGGRSLSLLGWLVQGGDDARVARTNGRGVLG